MSADCGESESLIPMKMCEPIRPNIKDGLVSRQTRLKSQLADIEAAIAALEANPEVANVLELVGKASRH